jgi:hypothetical protein
MTIMIDPKTRILNAVLLNDRPDRQMAKLREIADRMVRAILEGDDVHAE